MITIACIAMMVALLGIVALAYLFGRIDQREWDELRVKRLLEELKYYEKKVR